MSRCHRRGVALVLLVGLGALLGLAGQDTLLTALPVLGLFALLWAGRFPGERVLATRSRRRIGRRTCPVVLRPRLADVTAISAVLAAATSRRGPPLHVSI